jgi:peptidoglycan/LPS O-acetylase OafA/YrhL
VDGWDRRLETNSENSFDAIRLALATLVVFEHSYFLPFNSIANEPLHIFSRGQVDFGSLAVNFFFVLSGFLITRSWALTQRPGRYLQKRVARIVPGFLLASLLGIVIGALSSTDVLEFFSSINFRAILVQILSLHPSEHTGAFPNNPMKGIVSGTLWTIRYEFDCYLLVAIFGVLGWLRRVPVGLLFASLSMAYLAQRGGYLEIPEWDHGVLGILFSSPNMWPRLFTYFFAGAAFYLWRDVIPKSALLFGMALITIITALRIGGAEFVLIIAGTYCIFAIALSTAAVPRIQGTRVDLSYGVYLFGFPIQQLIIAGSSQSITPIWLFATSLPATCLVAYLSWVFIESPSLRWIWPSFPTTRERLAVMRRANF